jgi:LPS O-antigen subunit length determinant protein (WzzB/FepE family)
MLIMRLSIKELFYEKKWKIIAILLIIILLVYLCQIIKKNVYMSVKKLVKPITQNNG